MSHAHSGLGGRPGASSSSHAGQHAPSSRHQGSGGGGGGGGERRQQSRFTRPLIAPTRQGWQLMGDDASEKDLEAAFKRTCEETWIDLSMGRRPVPRSAALFMRRVMSQEVDGRPYLEQHPLGAQVPVGNAMMWDW